MFKNKLLTLVLFVFGLYLIVSLSRSLFSLVKKGEEVKNQNLKLEQLEKENQSLKEQLEKVASQEFIEKEARDKLGMARQGEQVLVLPKDVEKIVFDQEEQEEQVELPNWKKWWKLFF